MVKRLKVMTEFQCQPLWDQTEAVARNVSPEDLGLSPELASRLRRWAERFDETFDADYPPNSGFSTQSDLDGFEAEGSAIVEDLKRDLRGRWQVEYERTSGLRGKGR